MVEVPRISRDGLYESAPPEAHFEIVDDGIVILQRCCHDQGIAQELGLCLSKHVRECNLGQIVFYMNHGCASSTWVGNVIVRFSATTQQRKA
jgi:hypothetical protein